VSKACALFLVFPETSSTPLLPPSSAGSRDRAPSSNRFRIAAYLDPQVGLQGTWECDIGQDFVGINIKGFKTLNGQDFRDLKVFKTLDSCIEHDFRCIKGVRIRT
jgi:hypothetical protein